MRHDRRVPAAFAVAAALFLPGTTPRPDAPAPGHVHYERPAGFEKQSPGMPLAPRLQNLGIHKFPVTTKSARAQLFVNQGLNLAYGSIMRKPRARSRRRHASNRIAPWRTGVMHWCSDRTSTPRWRRKTNRRRSNWFRRQSRSKTRRHARERDYIDALAKRYTGKPEDRQKADRAFADAMRDRRRAVGPTISTREQSSPKR